MQNFLKIYVDRPFYVDTWECNLCKKVIGETKVMNKFFL